jgi:hypothetical protein
MTRSEVVRAAIVVGALLALCLLCTPFGFPIAPFQFLFLLAAGWIMFLGRAAPVMTIDWPSVGIAALAIVLFFGGSHALLGSPWRGAGKGAWPLKRSLAATVLVATTFVAGLSMVGLAHQVVWMFSDGEPIIGSTFTAHFRTSSSNNVRQIGFGLTNHLVKKGRYPPGGTRDDRGRMLHGWYAHLLPELAQQNLYDTIDFSKPWNDPHNAAAFREELPLLLVPWRTPLPERDGAGFAVSHYTANVLVLGGDKRRNVGDLPDGASNTLLAGEATTNPAPWGFPAHWRDPRLGINKRPDGFGGPFQGGALFLFADGSVRFLPETIDPRVLEAMATPDGGEKLDPDDSP